ncbi:alpha-crystallin A chain-like [Artemia franciscana]|uniref:SHSP domain-containing protein n=1 Tax=Artemia franciscana TaxID=6661 RepID=A0AA88HWG3_ARTSF|nr:hypothetical protein QYM36_006359 [Artemia franciscana]
MTVEPWGNRWTEPWDYSLADPWTDRWVDPWTDPYSEDLYYKPYGVPRRRRHHHARRRIRTIPGVFQKAGKDVMTKEDDKDWIVRVDLPGFRASEITVRSTEKEIIVHAVHKERPEFEGDEGYVSREIRRRLSLPKTIDPMEISSTFTPDGELTIRAPKTTPGAPRRRTVRVMPVPAQPRSALEEE